MVKVRKYERMYESNFNCDSTFWLVVCFLGLCSCECIHCDNFLGEIVLSLRLFNDIVLFIEELEVREIDILTETFSEERCKDPEPEANPNRNGSVDHVVAFIVDILVTLVVLIGLDHYGGEEERTDDHIHQIQNYQSFRISEVSAVDSAQQI